MKITINSYALLLMIAVLPGCFKKGKKACTPHNNNQSKVTIPFSQSNKGDIDKEMTQIDSFFDEESGELQDVVSSNNSAHDSLHDSVAWLQNASPVESAKFETVYFDFDKKDIKTNQVAKIDANAKEVKNILHDAAKNGVEATVVVEGHSCPLTKCESYNIALSENRAAVVGQEFEKRGIPANALKIVGRGAEVPALVDGKPVTGSKADLSVHRRVELHVVNA